MVWIELARSISRRLTGASGWRGGPNRETIGRGSQPPQLVADDAVEEELLLEPQWQRVDERGEAARGDGGRGGEEPPELPRGALVEGDGVEVRCIDAALLEAVAHRGP